MPNPAATFSDIQSRLKFADQEKLVLSVLDMAMALSLGKSVLPLGRPARAILSEAMSRLREILPWEGMAFYLAQGDDFHLTLCHPKNNTAIVARQIRGLIHDGVFALSVRDSRPITSYDGKEGQRLILGPINFNDRLKGVFLGSLRVDESAPSAVSLSLIKLVLGCCAESLELSEQLQLFHNKYSSLRDVSGSLAIVLLTAEGKLSFASVGAVRLFGITEAKVADTALADYLLLPETPLFPPFSLDKPVAVKVSLRNKPGEFMLHLLPAAKNGVAGVLLPASETHVGF